MDVVVCTRSYAAVGRGRTRSDVAACRRLLPDLDLALRPQEQPLQVVPLVYDGAAPPSQPLEFRSPPGPLK